jgi:hypothetical protein
MRASGIALTGLCVVGCGWNPFVPDTRTPADHAHDLAPKCTGDAMDAQALAPSLVESVEPLYVHVQSGNDRLIHLRGSEVHLRPMSTLSLESLQRRAECHQALVTMGRAEELPSDPYFLAGTWLDIKARSDGDSFIVAVQVDALDKAKEVLERARRFGPAAPAATP